MVVTRIEPGPRDLQPGTLSARPQRRSSTFKINYIHNRVLKSNVIKLIKEQRYFSKAKLYERKERGVMGGRETGK
jgi:hypothetical protein